jgi:hypothetical protein
VPFDGLKVTDFGNSFVEDWGDDVRYESAGYTFPRAQVLENGLAMGRHNKAGVVSATCPLAQQRAKVGYRPQMPQLVGIDDRAHDLDLALGHVEDHHAGHLVLAVEE